jgi:hypothetical protein
MTRVGLIGRCDSRGIAYQTLEFARHMHPGRTLVVELNDPAWPEDPHRFNKIGGDIFRAGTGAISGGRVRATIDERQARLFLRDVDVVFAVETLYDWRFADWAREAGVRTVIQANPEFYEHHVKGYPHPDLWVWPTDWLHDIDDTLPVDGGVLPVPCVDRPDTSADLDDPTLRIVHVAGHAAAGDRNGTLVFLEALNFLHRKIHVTIVGQDGALPARPQHRDNVTVDVIADGVDDRWDLYTGQHLVVLPRRYGGLCLPAIEAIACGVVPVMPDCSPNRMWPGPRFRSAKGPTRRTPHGIIQTAGFHPFELAQAIDHLAFNRNALAAHRDTCAQWRHDNSWAMLSPMYEQTLTS